MTDSTHKISLFLDKRELGILQPDGSYGKKNNKDWYITIPFVTTNKIINDYIQIYMDPFRSIMERQMVNPYFMDYGFFETIKSFSSSTQNANSDLFIETKSKVYNIDINK